MRAVLVGLVLTALTGCCASVPCKTDRIDMPVEVPCLGAKPARPAPTFGAGAYPGEKAAAQAALIDALAWGKYAIGLEAAMAGCR